MGQSHKQEDIGGDLQVESAPGVKESAALADG